MDLLLCRGQMFLLLSFALYGFAQSNIPNGRCHSPSLLQTNTRERGLERGDNPEMNLTSWKRLFPAHSLLDLGEMAEQAITRAWDTCSKMPNSYCDGWGFKKTELFNKSTVWKMLWPSVYAAADGSLRALAVATDYNLCQCTDNPKTLCPPNWGVQQYSGLLVSCGADNNGCAAVGPGLDPHAFQFQGHPMAFTTHQPGGFVPAFPYLVNLTSGEQVSLTLPGMALQEKNWQPFVYNGSLFFTQWLSPEHRVISCSVEDGSCESVFNTSSPFGAQKVRGSTPYVELDSNHLVAAAHKVEAGISERVYKHMFFAIQREPPFEVVAHTEWLMLPVPDGMADAEWVPIQYAGGLTRQGQDVILSYSVGDCISQAAKIPIDELKQALGL